MTPGLSIVALPIHKHTYTHRHLKTESKDNVQICTLCVSEHRDWELLVAVVGLTALLSGWVWGEVLVFVLFYECGCFACMCACAPCMCLLPTEAKREHQITCNQSYRWL